MAKSGYASAENAEKRVINNSVSVSEQETSISYMRDEDHAIVYTSDSTQMTRLDKLCKTSPDMYSLISNTGRGKTYRVEDKGLISFRAKKREMSEEAKEAASQRFKDMWASRE